MSLVSERIGKNVKRRRRALRLTQDEVAQKCGMSLRAYGQIERGSSNPKLSTLDKICEAFKIDVADLFKDN